MVIKAEYNKHLDPPPPKRLHLAVKVLQQKQKSENQEMAILKSFRHPHIVRYFHSFATRADFFEVIIVNSSLSWVTFTLQVYYIIMELCDSDLSKELKNERHEKMTPEATMELANQMSKATRYLELQRVIHRDIKPENILIRWRPDRSPQYKLADFGCVRASSCRC